jgi:hypothetical protein
MKKAFWLYLDDMRTPIDQNWIVVRSYDEFCTAVHQYGLENIERISFDHDLGESAILEYYRNVKDNYKIDYDNIIEKTGYDCAKWLVKCSMDTGIPIPDIYVHSANPIGAGNIIGYINNYLKNCRIKKVAELKRWDNYIDEPEQNV